ncbi:hypothetical protein P0C22_16385, partial [Plesiomonas shigelloides]|uniref:hypothetical protein n=1 Tax=Plesiomonas shigelloides TaxID=703 RepID=UPI0030BD7A08
YDFIRAVLFSSKLQLIVLPFSQFYRASNNAWSCIMRTFFLGALLVLQPTVSMSTENTQISSVVTSSSAIPEFKDYPSSTPYIGPAGKLLKIQNYLKHSQLD